MKIAKDVKLTSDSVAVTVLVVGYLYLCFRGFIPCWWYELTGLKCAGCGGCHLVQSLIMGDVISAFHYNAFLLLTVPVISILSFILKRNLKQLWLTYGALLIVWSIVRNIGGF